MSTSTNPTTVTRQIHFAVKGNRKQVRRGTAPESTLPLGSADIQMLAVTKAASQTKPA